MAVGVMIGDVPAAGEALFRCDPRDAGGGGGGGFRRVFSFEKEVLVDGVGEGESSERSGVAKTSSGTLVPMSDGVGVVDRIRGPGLNMTELRGVFAVLNCALPVLMPSNLLRRLDTAAMGVDSISSDGADIAGVNQPQERCPSILRVRQESTIVELEIQ
jgi:hypothetical protein